MYVYLYEQPRNFSGKLKFSRRTDVGSSHLPRGGQPGNLSTGHEDNLSTGHEMDGLWIWWFYTYHNHPSTSIKKKKSIDFIDFLALRVRHLAFGNRGPDVKKMATTGIRSCFFFRRLRRADRHADCRHVQSWEDGALHFSHSPARPYDRRADMGRMVEVEDPRIRRPRRPRRPVEHSWTVWARWLRKSLCTGHTLGYPGNSWNPCYTCQKDLTRLEFFWTILWMFWCSFP